MSFEEMIRRNLGGWTQGSGPESDVVLGSRVRLARNLTDVPFPEVAGPDQLKQVLQAVESAVKRDGRELGPVRFLRMEEIAPLEREILVERHLISPQHARDVRNKALVLRDDESVSIMVNEEDHLRIQALMPGLQLEEAWQLADRVDDFLDEHLDYAFTKEFGYLTAWPTNVGTGLRVSVMIHVPALGITDQLQRVMGAITRLGVAVRGIYGEGTQSQGHIYQISNQVSLGRSEEELVQQVGNLARQVIAQERRVREQLLAAQRQAVEDRVWRSYGILRYAHQLTSQEAMERLSDVRLGIDMGLIRGVDARILQELMVMIRPAHLQKFMGRELPAPERDLHRAELVRERLRVSGAEGA